MPVLPGGLWGGCGSPPQGPLLPPTSMPTAPAPCALGRSLGEECAESRFASGRRFKKPKKKEKKQQKKRGWDIYSHPLTVLVGQDVSFPAWPLAPSCRYGQEGLVELSRDDWERRRARGPMLESASEEVGKSLYQPVTTLERSSSSKTICAIPMKHLWSMRP